MSIDVLKNGKKLILKIIEASFLKEGTNLYFNPAGLESSHRPDKDKDGVSYFGKKNNVIII